MPANLKSSSESILVRFRTDDSINNKGFTLTYTAVDGNEDELIAANAANTNRVRRSSRN